MALTVIIAILLIYALYQKWRAARLGPPADCSRYRSNLRLGCKQAVKACGQFDSSHDVDACKSAVGACMPLASAASKLQSGQSPAAQFNQIAPHIPPCVGAALKVDPRGVAKLLKNMPGGGVLPPGVNPFFHDPTTRDHVEDIAGLVPPVVDWGLDVGRALPVKGSFTSAYTPPCIVGNCPSGWRPTCTCTR